MERVHEPKRLGDIFEFIQNCPAFADLSPTVNRLLARGMVLHAFDSGERILEQGSHCQGVFLIVSGQARVLMHNEEGEQELARISTGHVFGEMSLVTNSPVSADVIALSDLRTLRLDLESFKVIAQEHPEIGIALTHLTAERLGQESIDGLGGKILDGYRIRRCIGRGQMAVVYRATEVATGQIVALKMMSHRLLFEDGGIKRFHREADMMMTLEHPGIARHRRRFDAYGTCFLAMEYCDGEDLAALLRHRRRLPEAEVRKILGQLAQALIHLRERGVSHRDLKPSNVMATCAGEIKLTDFGLAHPRGVISDFDEGLLLGTPVYMPADQLRGVADTGSADLYALACIALELLHGTTPFRADSFAQLIAQKEAFRLRHTDMSWKLWNRLRRMLSGKSRAASSTLNRMADWAAPLSPEFRPSDSQA
ncbi:MAG: hypothetical protein ACI835_003262 [Planctomycetota bacterium]